MFCSDLIELYSILYCIIIFFAILMLVGCFESESVAPEIILKIYRNNQIDNRLSVRHDGFDFRQPSQSI